MTSSDYPVCPHCGHFDKYFNDFLKRDSKEDNISKCKKCGESYKIEFFAKYVFTTSKIES
jgi:hypothetical protein